MKKAVFEQNLKFTKEKKVEEITIELLAYSRIECKDRSFANQFVAGLNAYYLNELFDTLEELTTKGDFIGIKERAIQDIKTNLENYKEAYTYIRNSLHKMNNPSRVDDEIKEIKKELKDE